MEHTVTLTLTSSDTIMDLAYDSGEPITKVIKDWVRSANMEGKALGVRVIDTITSDQMQDEGVLIGTVMFDHPDNLRTWMSFLEPSLSDEDISDILSSAGL